MADYTRISDLSLLAGVQSEEVEQDAPYSSDIYYRQAELLNSLWEHLADAPVTQTETQVVEGHNHSRENSDDGIATYVGRVGIQGLPPMMFPETSVAISTTGSPTFAIPLFRVITPYTVNATGLLDQSAGIQFGVQKVLLTRDVKKWYSQEFEVNRQGGDTVRLAVYVYDDVGNVGSSDPLDTLTYGFTDVSSAGDHVITVEVDIPDSATADEFVWIVYWFAAWNATGTGTAATIKPHYPEQYTLTSTRQSCMTYTDGEP
jgi:hypothetical protein